ncbi:hypothetical protein QJQ45_007205 [Haematococcus lacustris]|nr:hypothetical protein QJQ45_007205 [Haematococcus lacustris]
MESDSDYDSESDCESEPESQSNAESEPEPEPVTQPTPRRSSARLAALAPAEPTGPPVPLDCEDPVMLRHLKEFFYNQLQRRLVRKAQHRHPMLMDPSNQALLAKLQELGNINLIERIVKLYAKAARAWLGWSGEEAQLFIKMACGYGINAKSSELQAATLDKGHVADLITEANKHRRLLGMKQQGSLQDTLPLPCHMRHAVHVCRCLEQWQQPPTLPVPGQPKRGKRRGVGPRTLTCPPPFTLTPMARVGLHFIKLDSRVLHGVCKQLGLTKETLAAFTSEPALSHHWARWFNTGRLANKGFEFERTCGDRRSGTSLVANLKHITVTLATWDAVWEVYLDPKWARQRLRLYGAQDQALEQFFRKMRVGGPRGAGQRRGRVVLVDEHRTTRVSSAVNGQQPCEEELNQGLPTRPAGWKPPAGQVDLRLLRPAWSQQRDQPVRGLMWCLVVAPRKPPQAPRSSQAATQPAASEPGPSTPPPAKRSKRTKAEQGKAAKANPAPQPGRWLDRGCNAALNMQRIGESRWRPLKLCFWPDQTALLVNGKEYPGLGYKRL